MQVPQDVIKSLSERKIKISDAGIIEHGSAKLTVEYSHVTFNKDFSVATPVFKVVAVDKPEPKTRKPRAQATAPTKKQ